MQVEVRLFSSLRKGRFTKRTVELFEPACLRDLLRRLALAEKEVSMSLVNGRFCGLERPLADRDVVALFPPIGGG
jgi:molybdopterin converting factor small subunit